MTTAQPYVTAREAAEEVGLSYTRIRALLRRGRVMGAIKPQRDWLIPSPVDILPPKRTPRRGKETPADESERDERAMSLQVPE